MSAVQDFATPVLTALGAFCVLTVVVVLAFGIYAWASDVVAARQRARRRGELDKARAVREAERLVRARRTGGR